MVIYKLLLLRRPHLDRLEANRKYDCFCGSGIAADFVAGYILEKHNLCFEHSAPFKVAIISDRQVSGYYYNIFENQFILRNIKPRLIVCDAQEGGKSLKTVSEIVADLTDTGLGCNDWIIALGGGGVIDVAEFAASIYSGRSSLLLVPTTMGAMACGAIEDRACLNSGKYKNTSEVEVYPDAVFVDPQFLQSVPVKYRSNGYAPVIRLAMFGNIHLLDGINDSANLREFLNEVYAARKYVEIKNPKLLTLGDEIAAAIEGYFRFMNYSDGEALALSLYSCMPEAGRMALETVYNRLGLPTKLDGVGRNMILRSVSEGLTRKGMGPYEIVDYEKAGDGGKWVIRSMDRDSAMELFARRMDVIVPADKN